MSTLILAIVLALVSPIKDKDGHSLGSMWEDYYSAEAKDKTRDQLSTLEKIKKKAEQQRLSWDYYDACEKYLSVSTYRNWKVRDSLRTKMRSEIESYNDATVLFYDSFRFSSGAASDMLFVMNNRSRLENSHNPEFYANDYRITSLVFGEALKLFIKNDFDYCLWALYSNDYNTENKNILLRHFENQYPYDAFLGLQGLSIEGHKAYEAKYIDKAVSLFSTQKILLDRFEKLNEKGGSGEDFIALRDDILQTIKKKQSFKGSERIIAECCKLPENLLEQLNAKRVDAKVVDGELLLLCRNTSRVNVKIYNSEKKLIDQNFSNKQNSFYVTDTIRYRIDTKLLDDDYTIIYGNNQKLEYSKYTLSIASRKNNKGLGIFVADYISGEPIKECSINLYDSESTLIAQSPTFPLNAFTNLPTSFASRINDKEIYYIQAVYTDSKSIIHLSPKHPISGRYAEEDAEEASRAIKEALILCDRGAYNPGDTIQFKAILYSSNRNVIENSPVIAELINPKGEKIESHKLTTNAFGSVASSFILKEEILGGTYRLRISSNDGFARDKSVVVDEFVLPTFNLTWDKNDRIYLPGDEVEIKGNVKAYSGHNLSSANIHYKVTADRDTYIEGPLEYDSDGNFSVKFTSQAEKERYIDYNLNIVVSDSTGETWDYNRFINFTNYVDINVRLLNFSEGRFSKPHQLFEERGSILSENVAKFDISSHNNNVAITYSLSFNGEEIDKGEINSEDFSLDFEDKLSGLYELKVYAKALSDSGLEFANETSLNILKALDNDKALYSDIIGFFKEVEGYGLSLQIGATGGPVWAVAELYGDGNKLLDRKLIKLIGQKGQTGSLRLISFERKDSYPENLSFNVFYFRDKLSYRYRKSFLNIRQEATIPIEFIRFLDTTLPASEYNFAIQTRAGVEACASIFDVSTETIRSNVWNRVRTIARSQIGISYDESRGSNDSNKGYFRPLRSTDIANGRGVGDDAITFSLAKSASSTAEMAVLDSAAAEEEQLNESINIRENFANTLAWEPFLQSNENGRIDLSFKTSDKLSKYYVQLFVHDKRFNNGVSRKEFSVTIPVKVSFVPARYLYETDKYVARMNVSNNFSEDISGDVFIQFANQGQKDASQGSQEQMNFVKRVTIPAKGSISFSASPSGIKEGELMILAGFKPVDARYSSDAVKISIPIRKAQQEITETHSSLVFQSSNRDTLLANLRSQFVNKGEVQESEISIKDLLNDALPKEIRLDYDDIISVSSAIYSAINRPGIISEGKLNLLINKFIACNNRDGGFAWFPGMASSAIVTAKVLERCYAMANNCPKYITELLPSAVKYLDKQYFREEAIPIWRGGIGLEEYLYVRSMYCSEDFSLKDINLKALAIFAKETSRYLAPSNERGLNAQILAKTRRALTLRNLINQKGAKNLLDAWGLNLRLGARAKRSLEADMESLSQYAEKHSSGGYYFPNAIMPFRGLLASELYAATLICNLFDTTEYQYIADGLRLWIMVQKESQQWENDPAYIDALCCVSKAKEETLSTKVLILKNVSSLPFEQVKATGNGFRIQSEYRANGRLLKDGDKLKLGDKVIARHSIWSEENRSFVNIRLPRPSCLRPLIQSSGYFAWRFSAYRYIKADESVYMFESFPEESSSFSEEFFVTSEGKFYAPAPIVESSYAPHYRANGEMTSISAESIQP